MATSWRSKKNYPLGQGTLNTAIDDNDLTIVLDAGQGAGFPAATFTISIDEEIILIDSRSTDTLTVNASGRGYDNSTASAHAAGVAIANNQIVKDFTDIETAVNGIENGTTTLAKVITSGTAANTHTIDDATTNAVVSVLELYKTSSGTPASGIGAKLLLGGEDSAGNAESAIEIHGYLTTVTSTSEQGAFLLRVKNAGSFIDALAISVASITATIGSNQTTANLWNTTATTVNAWGTATAITIGADSDSGSHLFRGGTYSFGSIGSAGVRCQMNLTNTVNNTTSPTFTYLKARYSSGLQQVQANDFLGAFEYKGYHSSSAYGGVSAMFRVKALENFTSGAQGTSFLFETTIAGSTTRSQIMELNWSGSSLYGNCTFGSLSTHTYQFVGRMIVRTVTDAGPMTATPGTAGEIVRNTSDAKFYGCTVTHGTAATWVAFN